MGKWRLVVAAVSVAALAWLAATLPPAPQPSAGPRHRPDGKADAPRATPAPGRVKEPSPAALRTLLDSRDPALRLAAARRLARQPKVGPRLLLARLDSEPVPEVACQLVLAAKQAGRREPAPALGLARHFGRTRNVEVRGTVISAFELYPGPADREAIEWLVRDARPGEERERAIALRQRN